MKLINFFYYPSYDKFYDETVVAKVDVPGVGELEIKHCVSQETLAMLRSEILIATKAKLEENARLINVALGKSS